MKSTILRQRLPFFVLCTFLLLILVAGKLGDFPDTGDPGTQDGVNFETDPPIATKIIVQKLESPDEFGNNVLFTASYDKEMVGDMKEITLFVNQGDKEGSGTKIVLNDEGINGDEKPGDFIFSSFVAEDLDLFAKSIENAELNLREAENTIASFNNRAATVSKVERIFDMESFNAFKPVELSRNFFSILPPLKPTGFGGPCTPFINRFKSLFITDISVTEDLARTFNPCTGAGNPNGAWTFKTLMTNIANVGATGVTVDSLTREWLETFLKGNNRAAAPTQPAVVVNGQVLDTRVHTTDNIFFSSTFNAIIRPWLRKASGNPGLVVDSLAGSPNHWKTIWRNLVTGGTDVMRFAPFKLTAIVNRVDLRGNSHYGGSISSAGEGRFIFSIIKDPGTNCTTPVTGLVATQFSGFNVIFEYGVPLTSCAALKAYQQQWRNLSDSAFSPVNNFNGLLQTITDVFTAANAAPGKPNGSALNQLRTNEIANTSPKQIPPGNSVVGFWQLREFNVSATPATLHRLINVTVKQEPRSTFNGSVLLNGSDDFNGSNTNTNVARMAEWVNNNTTAIRSNHYTVPDSILPTGLLNKVPFLAGRSDVSSPAPTGTNHHWNGRGTIGATTFINDDSARFVFSLNTCSGCHGGETKTAFTMVRHNGFGHNITPTSITGGVRDISGFLTGLGADDLVGDNDSDPNGFFWVNDAAGRPSATYKRGFNDLMMRQQSMTQVLCNGCGFGGVLIDILEAVTFMPSSKTD